MLVEAMEKREVLATELVLVPAGSFLMGQEGGLSTEGPVHEVWVDDFWIAVHAVTREQYALFLDATGHTPPRFWQEEKFQHPRQPVVGPSWHDAMAYCAWLGEQLGQSFRLPTEAEREKAARGGVEQQAYPWGDALPAEHQGGRDFPLEEVALGAPNGYGLYNMADGVHEWCMDWYAPFYYKESPFKNPQGPPSGKRKIARGGSWRHIVCYTRNAARSSLGPEKQFSDFGFRIASSG